MTTGHSEANEITSSHRELDDADLISVSESLPI